MFGQATTKKTIYEDDVKFKSQSFMARHAFVFDIRLSEASKLMFKKGNRPII